MTTPSAQLMRRRALRTVAFVSATLLLTACDKLTAADTTTTRYGAVNIAGKATSATAASASAVAVFFEAVSAAVPNSALQRDDLCAFTSYDTLGTTLRGVFMAGNTIPLTVGSTTTSLPFEDLNQRYATPTGQRFTYNAGDVASVSVPGNGAVYPAVNISVKLAEPIVPGALVVPTTTTTFPVTWNASTDTSSAMLLALRYVVGSGGSAIAEQVYCSAKDDGRFDIPGSALTNFLAAQPSTRSLLMTRFRTNQVLIDPKTLMFIGSTIDTTIALR